jgi:hypothetical protein
MTVINPPNTRTELPSRTEEKQMTRRIRIIDFEVPLAVIEEVSRFVVRDEEDGSNVYPADFGNALGVSYEDDEVLTIPGKEHERDVHRWELNPASSEDYQERM